VGIRPRDSFYFAFTWGTFIGFWSAYWGVRRLGATVYSGGGVNTEMRLKQILELEPTVLVSTPTYALAMAEKAGELGIDLSRSSIRWTYHAGEPGGNVPTTRRAIEEAWGAKAYELYGIGEVGAIAPGCPLQLGVHLAEDQAYATVVNPETGRPVAEGEAGENVVTSYVQFSQPVIKYRTHDLVRPVRTRCACGRTWLLFEGGVLGRTDHMIIIRGTNVYPTAVEALLGDVPGLSPHYEIHVARRRGGDELTVKVEARPDVPADRYADLRRRAEQLLYERILVRIGVDVQAPGQLPRYELKARRFFDDRGA
jgi:phenylacetate-CoA ligase